MNPALLELIPEARREAVQAALAHTFGRAPVDDLQPVLGGASGASIYRFTAAGRAYVLRLDLSRDVVRDPKRHYAAMEIAAEAGVAPALHYADPDAAISIMDLVQAQPLPAYRGGTVAMAGELGGLLARLQATDGFPVLADYAAMLERMFGYVAASDMFAPGLLEPHGEGFQGLREAYPWDPAHLVSSHNDPNFRNLLFDGRRLWLVDWETAYRNEAMVDVAIQANELEAGPELADILLTAWSGRAPDARMRAQLMVMRQITRFYYAVLILCMQVPAPRERPDEDLTAPTADEFRAAVAEGRLAVGSPQMMYLLGKMMLAGFLEGVRAPCVQEAADLLRQG